MFKQLREYHRKEQLRTPDQTPYQHEAQEQMVASLLQEVLQKYEEAGGDAAHTEDGDAAMDAEGGEDGAQSAMMPEPVGIFQSMDAATDAMEQ
jgi:hypothetical protein